MMKPRMAGLIDLGDLRIELVFMIEREADGDIHLALIGRRPPSE